MKKVTSGAFFMESINKFSFDSIMNFSKKGKVFEQRAILLTLYLHAYLNFK